MRRVVRRNTLNGPGHIQTTLPGQVQGAGGGNLEFVAPVRKKTQEDQDEADEQQRREAMKDLVQSWMDRLQLISLITTFLASVEAGMLQVTAPDPGDDTSRISQASNASFLCSLVLHLHASFISFFAAFFLIRFKVKEARREEAEAEGERGGPGSHSKGSILLDMAAKHITNSPSDGTPSSTFNTKGSAEKGRSGSPPPIWSANPQLVQVGLFQRQPPMHLLHRCHTLCVVTTVIGFILALVGVVCYAWASQPLSVSICTTVCVGLCTLSGVGLVLMNNDNSSFLFQE